MTTSILQENERLRFQLWKAEVRIGILQGRMRACDETKGQKHKLSIDEADGWLEEITNVLKPPVLSCSECERKDEALKEALEVLNLSDPEGHRAKHINVPEDREIGARCEALGYGAVMDAAARLWRKKDPIGAHTTGAAVATVQDTVRLVRAALSAPKEK